MPGIDIAIHHGMKRSMSFRAIIIVSVSIPLIALTGCGENVPGFEEALGKVFVTGTNREGSSFGDLSKETVGKLNLDVDDEAAVVSNLTTLKDKDFDIDGEHKNVLVSLNYITTIVRRSELLPKDKQSPCQCHYAASTFKLAVEVLGEYLIKLQKQNLMMLVKEELEKYQQLYQQFSLGKEILGELSKVDILKLPMAKNGKEREELEEIKKAAAEALKELSSIDSSAEKPADGKKEDKENKKSDADEGSRASR